MVDVTGVATVEHHFFVFTLFLFGGMGSNLFGSLESVLRIFTSIHHVNHIGIWVPFAVFCIWAGVWFATTKRFSVQEELYLVAIGIYDNFHWRFTWRPVVGYECDGTRADAKWRDTRR